MKNIRVLVEPDNYEEINMKNAPRVLFTTPILRHPAVGGPFLRIENSIKALSEITELYIYSQIELNETEVSFYKQFCKEIYFPPSVTLVNRCIRFSKCVFNYFKRKLLRNDVFSCNVGSETQYRDLLEVADVIKTDCIWLGYGNISYPLLKYIKENSNYKVIVDTDSVWSRFVLRGLPYATSEEERKKIEKAGKEKEEEERWGTQLADITTAVSEVDAEYYRSLAKYPQQIHIFSNVIDIKTYQQVPPPVANFKKPCIYLAGTFGPRSPMDDAARWVIENVFPRVSKKISDVHFYIVGSGSDQTLFDIKDPGITITGKLPSVLPYLCHTDVALVPLRFESGTRFKIMEAGACKIPMVSTTLGAEGLSVENGKHILIADTPESFADAIIVLLTNPELGKKLKEDCYKLIEERCNIDTAIKEAKDILNTLGITQMNSKQQKESNTKR